MIFEPPKRSAPIFTIPLYPFFLFFFNTMFMIPAILPDASYFADGFVITSTFSMISAGIWSIERLVGRPSINKVGFALRTFTLPSMSTCTDGILRITSMAVPPVVTRFCATLKDFLSMSISTKDFVPVTTTFSNSFESNANLMLPKSFSKAAIIFAISGCWPGSILGISNTTAAS